MSIRFARFLREELIRQKRNIRRRQPNKRRNRWKRGTHHPRGKINGKGLKVATFRKHRHKSNDKEYT